MRQSIRRHIFKLLIGCSLAIWKKKCESFYCSQDRCVLEHLVGCWNCGQLQSWLHRHISCLTSTCFSQTLSEVPHAAQYPGMWVVSIPFVYFGIRVKGVNNRNVGKSMGKNVISHVQMQMLERREVSCYVQFWLHTYILMFTEWRSTCEFQC